MNVDKGTESYGRKRPSRLKSWSEQRTRRTDYRGEPTESLESELYKSWLETYREGFGRRGCQYVRDQNRRCKKVNGLWVWTVRTSCNSRSFETVSGLSQKHLISLSSSVSIMHLLTHINTRLFWNIFVRTRSKSGTTIKWLGIRRS